MQLLTRFKKLKLQFKWSEDRAILMICMGIALIFWIFIKLSQEYTAEKQVLFNFQIPSGKAFTKAPPNDFRVDLVGPGWDLMYDFFASRTVTLDYQMLDRDVFLMGRSQLERAIQEKLFSRSLNVRSMNYDRLQLNLEPMIEKNVPVRLQTRLQFGNGYQLEGPVKSQPDTVRITGPASVVDSIKFWQTDSLIRKNLTNTQTVQVDLLRSPREFSLNMNSVLVTVPVEQYTEKSVFVPIQVLNAPDTVKIFPANIAVKFVVGLSNYNEIDRDDFSLSVDLKDKSLNEDGENTASILLNRQPLNIRNVNFAPREVRYFTVKDTSTVKEEPLLQQ